MNSIGNGFNTYVNNYVNSAQLNKKENAEEIKEDIQNLVSENKDASANTEITASADEINAIYAQAGIVNSRQPGEKQIELSLEEPMVTLPDYEKPVVPDLTKAVPTNTREAFAFDDNNTSPLFRKNLPEMSGVSMKGEPNSTVDIMYNGKKCGTVNYDSLGRISSISYKSNNYTYEYYGDSYNIKSENIANKDNSKSYFKTFNEDGTISSSSKTENGKEVSKKEYTYYTDENGNFVRERKDDKAIKIKTTVDKTSGYRTDAKISKDGKIQYENVTTNEGKPVSETNYKYDKDGYLTETIKHTHGRSVFAGQGIIGMTIIPESTEHTYYTSQGTEAYYSYTTSHDLLRHFVSSGKYNPDLEASADGPIGKLETQEVGYDSTAPKAIVLAEGHDISEINLPTKSAPNTAIEIKDSKNNIIKVLYFDQNGDRLEDGETLDKFGENTDKYKIQHTKAGLVSGINFTSQKDYDNYEAPETYIANGKIALHINGKFSTTFLQYDSNGKLQGIVDANGKLIKDMHKLEVKIKDPSIYNDDPWKPRKANKETDE